MSGSRKVRVVKRDGSREFFNRSKLGVALWRGIQHTTGTYDHARQLAKAIELYLIRTDQRRISSAALFEMGMKVLRRVGLDEAGEVLEGHRAWRRLRRLRLKVRQEGGRMTFWDKSWLAEFIARSWHLSRATARILAGQIELELLAGPARVVDRQAVIDLLNDRVLQFGLADAVPVQQYK